MANVVSNSLLTQIQFNRFLLSGALIEAQNYTTFTAIVALCSVFPTISFIIELIAAKGLP